MADAIPASTTPEPAAPVVAAPQVETAPPAARDNSAADTAFAMQCVQQMNDNLVQNRQITQTLLQMLVGLIRK